MESAEWEFSPESPRRAWKAMCKHTPHIAHAYPICVCVGIINMFDKSASRRCSCRQLGRHKHCPAGAHILYNQKFCEVDLLHPGIKHGEQFNYLEERVIRVCVCMCECGWAFRLHFVWWMEHQTLSCLSVARSNYMIKGTQHDNQNQSLNKHNIESQTRYIVAVCVHTAV